MKVEQLPAAQKYRKTARNLLTEVSRIMEEAGKVRDLPRRHELYLQAMHMSDEAYSLLGKARRSANKKLQREPSSARH